MYCCVCWWQGKGGSNYFINIFRVTNKHIYFQDDEGIPDNEGVEVEEKTSDIKSEDIKDSKGMEEKINGENTHVGKEFAEKINGVKSEDTDDITLKREGGQLDDTPPCKKLLVTEM
jgi:hypothetical protein